MNYNHEEFVKRAEMLLVESKCYEIVYSTKDRLKCDSDELCTVTEAIKTGSVAKLRQGMFNPSFYVIIVLDETRTNKFKTDIMNVVRENKRAIEYNGSDGLVELPKFKKLPDVFSGIKLQK